MIRIQPARKSDEGKIIALANEQFGSGYLTRKDIGFDRYLVLYMNNRFAGFVNTELYDPAEWGDDEETDVMTGLIETIALASEFQRGGLGTLLIAAAKCYLIQEGVRIIYCYAAHWSDINFAPVAPALERNGFAVQEIIPKMWKDDPPDYRCRACGHPCQCDAVLYMWRR